MNVAGKEVSHIRDCSDGSHFSFSGAKYRRLFDLRTNNETACTFDGENMFCLTQCASNLCNGPQPGVIRHGDTAGETKDSSLVGWGSATLLWAVAVFAYVFLTFCTDCKTGRHTLF